ncbi:alanine--glyoxylate aminotransferase family protein [Bacillota bacterium LX-D]|nr:alanine--glyoxylate aminotransferase family protein [Bacillota bacterium LX-D]
MSKEKLLMTPGPTMVPHEVLATQSEVMIHHRTPEYGKLFTEMNENLRYLYQTNNTIISYSASGTGGLEASVVNFFSPGDKILVISIGVFGNRYAAIAQSFGLNVVKIDVPWGQGVDPKEVEKYLAEGGFKAVFATHNETSTGAVNDIKAISQVLKGQDLLFIVDAVSSLGAIELQTDLWGIDVVISASQKAIMCPPGLAFMSVSPKAWEAAEKSTCPKFYWDILKAKKALEKNPPQNPFTPPISLVRGVNMALKLIKKEGLAAIFARHNRLAQATQAGVEALGLKLFAAPAARSSCITSVALPENLDGNKIRSIMEEKYGVIIAGGQEHLKGKIIRIGHMGYVNENNVYETFTALEKTLQELNYNVQLGTGVQAAQEAYNKAL